MATPHRIPIALVDDHTLFRGVLADMINALGGYEVVLEAGNGKEFVQGIEDRPVTAAIVDLHMPVMDGYATLAWIREHRPGTRALALTFEKTEDAMVRALRAGACGFLLKNATKSEFQRALEAVIKQGYYYNVETAKSLEHASGEHSSHSEEREQVMRLLTDREAEFMRLVSDEAEHTYEQIADMMGVHVNTVHGYRESVFFKFKIKSKAGLVIFAYKWGLVQARKQVG